MPKNTDKNAIESNKKARQKYLKENYKSFNLCLPIELITTFKELCKTNKTTPTTVLKTFIEQYIKNHTKEK